MALGGTTGAWLLSRSADTQTVLVVASPVARGEEIDAMDLTSAELPAGAQSLRTVPVSELESVVGMVATTDLLSGSVLTPDAIADELLPSAGSSIVGLSLPSSQMPSQPLVAGDRIRFVASPPPGGEMPIEAPETIEAVVINAQVSDGGWHLDVELPTAEAPTLVALAATARIGLVIDAAG